MTAAGGDGQFEQAFTCCHRTSTRGKAACFHARDIVHRKDSISRKPLEQPVIDHGARALSMLFIWLEDKDNPAIEVTLCCQMTGSPQQHGRMPVMAAGMHCPVMHRHPFRRARLGDGKGIHISAEGNTAGAVAALQNADDACLSDVAVNLDAEGFKKRRDVGRGALLSKPRFGVAMEITAPAGHLRYQFGGNLCACFRVCFRTCLWGFVHLAASFVLSALIISAAFSAIMMVGALVLPDIRVGITDASTTRSLRTP